MRITIALVVAAAAIISGCDGSKPDYERWALPSFEFSDMPNFGTLFVTGTLKGRDVGYPVNTWNIQCYRQQMTCHVADVSEIGKGQLGEIFLDDWTVTSWTDNAVVLDQNDPTSCAHNLIVINRVAKTVEYSSTPANQDKNYCQGYNKFAGPQSNEKWEIGQPVQPWEREAKR
jgi:hypothetical protein